MSSDPLLSREWVDAMEWVQNKQQQQQQQQQHQRENEQQQQQMETRKRTGVSQFSPSFGKRMAFTPSFGKRYSWPSLFQVRTETQYNKLQTLESRQNQLKSAICQFRTKFAC